MKNFKNLFAVSLLAMVLFYGCNDDDPVNEVVPEEMIETPTSEEFRQLQASVLDQIRQETQFEAEEGIEFESEKGVLLEIYAGTLKLDGEAVTGPVDLEFIEIFDASRMLATNKPTMGIRENGNKALLISGGEFYVNVTQNGEQLDISNHMKLVVPTDLTGGADQEMTLWNGQTDENENLAWEEDRLGPDGAGNLFVEGDQYYGFLSGFGWSNVDRFYNDPRPKTTLEVIVPNGYHIQNCSVYLYYDGEPYALAQLDTFNETANSFSEHYGEIPIGLEMHVIFITEEDGEWKYSIQPQTVADGDVYTFEEDDFITGTESDVYNAIEALP
ncbi:hypothetical protein SAMN05661096_02061 [Marivirga sericea]|uniref:Uncharacterized protein n=1 Tax=Marivirga sericea TaxID=1028 RepID=A0A1X7JZ21_9BACT|nr:hypothetical protein [Marivirga sericea]SMG33031.1 hypothetical protein SAMN05661096_02061 [Marivirga sericea]